MTTTNTPLDLYGLDPQAAYGQLRAQILRIAPQNYSRWRDECRGGDSATMIEAARRYGVAVLTAEESLQQRLSEAVEDHINAVAAARGYGSKQMPPGLSARAYAGYANQFQAECIVFGQWVADCWGYCYQVWAAVQAGQRAVPTAPQLLAELPVMVWP